MDELTYIERLTAATSILSEVIRDLYHKGDLEEGEVLSRALSSVITVRDRLAEKEVRGNG